MNYRAQLKRVSDNGAVLFNLPPDLTVAEWAAEFRYLSAESSAEPGKYDLSRTPHCKLPMELLSPSHPCKRVLLPWSSQIVKTTYTRTAAYTGAVTLIQCFGSALNLNIHFHILFLDGVYVNGADARFRWVKAPTDAELSKLTHTIAYRIGRYLERQGWLARDAENSYLALENLDEEPMDQLRGYSITYRIAVGSQQGRKVFTLQTLPGSDEPFSTTAGNIAGFSLHARLAALVPRPRVNLTRYHGVFAPNSKYRALITPAKRGKGSKPGIADEPDEQTPVPRHVAMTPDQVRGRLWAQRLKRVFNIDVETCRACGGRARVIACIEDPQVIKKILAQLEKKAQAIAAPRLNPNSRAPPQASLFG